jgi:hypothetical protein
MTIVQRKLLVFASFLFVTTLHLAMYFLFFHTGTIATEPFYAVFFVIIWLFIADHKFDLSSSRKKILFALFLLTLGLPLLLNLIMPTTDNIGLAEGLRYVVALALAAFWSALAALLAEVIHVFLRNLV